MYFHLPLQFPFSLFAAVSLHEVVGLAETYPFIHVSGPFLTVPPLQPASSSMALPHQLNFGNCSGDFCFISSFHVPEPFPHSSHDHHNRLHICFLQVLISTMLRLTHIAHRTILIFAVAIHFIPFDDITIISRLIGLNYLIYFTTFDLNI